MKKNKSIFLFELIKSYFKTNDKNEILYNFAHVQDRFRYFFLIENIWFEAKFENNEFYSITNNDIISKLNKFIISYRNGDFVYGNFDFRSYPEQISWMREIPATGITIDKNTLITGNHLAEISFSSSPIFGKDSNYYETKIKNISSVKFKVINFGGFLKDANNKYQLNTITNNYFSDNDFQNWYMRSGQIWIYPNEIVSDPINYGGAQNNWAYQIETETGELLWISSIHE
jgi:hypothetical protein